MSLKKYSEYQKQILTKWANRIGMDQLYDWLIPAIEAFAQGRATGMKNGAPIKTGARPTMEDEKFGLLQLSRFKEALQDFDWLLGGYMEKVPT